MKQNCIVIAYFVLSCAQRGGFGVLRRDSCLVSKSVLFIVEGPIVFILTFIKYEPTQFVSRHDLF